MQALVLLNMGQFRAIWFDVVPFNASYAYLRQPHIFKPHGKKEKKKIILHSSKYGSFAKASSA